ATTTMNHSERRSRSTNRTIVADSEVSGCSVVDSITTDLLCMRLCSELSQAESNPRQCKAEVGLSICLAVVRSPVHARAVIERRIPGAAPVRSEIEHVVDRLEQIDPALI